MTSVSSMPHSAPSENSAGSHANAHYANEPLPPKGQQGQSWLQSAAHSIRNLFVPMPEDPLELLAKAKDLHYNDPPNVLKRSFKDQWKPWRQSDRHKMACSIYKDIAPKLLVANKKVEAGEAYEATGLLQLKYYSKDDLEMMGNEDNFNQAYLAYYDVQPLASARCLEQLIKLKLDEGRLRSAAPLQNKLGELYMEKCDDPGAAIAAWQKAGDWYRNDRAMSTAIGIYKKIAEICAQRGDYYKAIEVWDRCADDLPDRSSIGRSGQAFSFFFNAGLCHVATGDTVALSRAIQHYVNLENSFSRTPECRFLSDLSKVMEDGDEERYQFLWDSFDSIYQLPGWKTKLLEEGKKHLEGGDNFA
ncbi:MAG: hypothetical protein Q9195_005055 [Heterodermia aff. obscurata]